MRLWWQQQCGCGHVGNGAHAIQVEPMEPVDEDGFNWAKMLESASPSFRKAWEEGLAKCSPLAILPQQPSLHENRLTWKRLGVKLYM